MANLSRNIGGTVNKGWRVDCFTTVIQAAGELCLIRQSASCYQGFSPKVSWVVGELGCSTCSVLLGLQMSACVPLKQRLSQRLCSISLFRGVLSGSRFERRSKQKEKKSHKNAQLCFSPWRWVMWDPVGSSL